MNVDMDQPIGSPVKIIHDYARRNKITADYILESESGPAHRKVFTMRLRLGEKEYVGVDRSIKLAQRAAAQAAFVDQESVLKIDNKREKTQKANFCQPSTVLLNTWAAQHHLPTKYIFLGTPMCPSNMSIIHQSPRQIFCYRLIIGEDINFNGFGTSGNQARINCASQALNFIRNNPIFFQKQDSTLLNRTIEKSPITLMYERARKLGLSVNLDFDESSNVTYRIGEQYSATGTGANKQAAKLNAAEKLLEILPIMDEVEKDKTSHKRNTQHQKFIQQKGSSNYASDENINPITRLYQIAQARNVSVKFEELEKFPNDKLFRFRVQYADDLVAEGFGKSKQIAKRFAAENVLLKINLNRTESTDSSPTSLPLPPAPSKSLLKRENNRENNPEKKHVHFLDDEAENSEKTSTGSCEISVKEQLTRACENLNIKTQYQDDFMKNDSKVYQSILSLTTGDRLLAKFRGQGPSIERAQENVSNAAWINLRQLFDGSISAPKSNDKTKYRRVQKDSSHSKASN